MGKSSWLALMRIFQYQSSNQSLIHRQNMWLAGLSVGSQGHVLLYCSWRDLWIKTVKCWSCRSMSGKERANFKFKGNLSVAALQRLLAQRLDVHQAMLRAVLPNGEILRQQNPKETLASVLCIEGA